MSEQPLAIFGEGHREAVIAICTLTSIQNKAYATHLQFAYKLAKDNPEFRFSLITPYRMTIANFRNLAADLALNTNSEYLMFIDDDAVLYRNESLFKNLKDKIDKDENKHIVMPVVYVRGYPFNPMFFKFVEDAEILKTGKGLDFYNDFKEKPVDENSLLEIAAIGCHTALIKTEVFKALEKPYFLTGMNHTEDVYFCMKCRDYIENIGIYVATDIVVGHLLDPLWVDDYNVEILKEFYAKLETPEAITASLNQPDQIGRDMEAIGEDFDV